MDQWHSQGTVERFRKKVDISGGPNACWPWLGAKNREGYGKFKARGTTQNASRVALEIYLDRPLLRDQANHICDNPSCCNPSHLYVGNQSQNIKDSYDRRRRGSMNQRRNS